MSKSKSSSFPLERILKELDFLAETNTSRVSYLYLGDANFGLFDRDISIAQRLRDLRDTKGFPQNVYLYFAKNSSKRVVEIAGILQGMTPISLSRQTQNEDVLKNIKRKNINIETFNSLSRHAKDLGIDSFAELIYALPGESLESFLSGVADVLESDVDGLHFFPAMLLEGSEMGTQRSRDIYGLQGEFRAIDRASGDYEHFAASEFEEIVTTTAVFSRTDYFTVRRLHFIQSVLLDVHAGGRIFYGLRGLTGGRSLYRLLESIAREPGSSSQETAFWDLLQLFDDEAAAEFVSTDELETLRYSTSAGRPIVKLNPFYLTRILYEPGRLDAFLNILRVRLVALYETDQELVDAVLDVIRQRIYPFENSTRTLITSRLDLGDLARAALAPQEAPLTPDHLLATPQEVVAVKENTYEDVLKTLLATQSKQEAIYDLLLHHSRENVGRLLTWSLASGDHKAGRTLTHEGGWLF